MGYCIFPLVLAAIISALVNIGWKNIWFNFGMAAGGLVWSIWASVGFLSAAVPDHRRLLSVYPVILFYSALAWLIIASYKTGASGTTGGSTTTNTTVTTRSF